MIGVGDGGPIVENSRRMGLRGHSGRPWSFPRRTPVPLIAVILAVCLIAGAVPALTARDARELPARLTDQEFWALIVESSEPDGYFRSDNLTSNELGFQAVIPDLLGRTKPGRAYLGVGPEQNFTYITAVRPSIAIIFDIRRGNMLVQLMYKALFELARDRADFMSMLFARPRPAGLGPESSVSDLFSAFANLPPNEALYKKTLDAIRVHLTSTRHLPLAPADISGLEYVLSTFYYRGYGVRSWPTYADLMIATDSRGTNRSYLATEANFTFLKGLQSRNLVVPVVGDFGGPKAIRAIGRFLKGHGAVVSTFYLSNVEQYLYGDGKWQAFCGNVAALPLDQASTFIRSSSAADRTGRGFVSSLGMMAEEVKGCGLP